MALGDYQRIFDTCEPYLVARASIRDELDHAPLGIAIPDANVFDPQEVGSGPFLRALEVLDETAFGPLGMRMPSWVFYDCAMMPGAVFGFARRAGTIERWVRRALGVPEDYDGLVPVSLFIAIPVVERPIWLGHSLCSINEVAPGGGPEGLWRVTLAAGTAAMRIHRMIGTTRWRSPRLGLYAGLGPLELVTAWTPAHDIRATVTFRVRTDAAARESLLSVDPPTAPTEVHRYLDADDADALRALQDEIERGAHVYVVGPAEIRGAVTHLPLRLGEGEEHAATSPEPGFTRRFQG